MANDVYIPPSPYRLTEKYNSFNRNLSMVSDTRRGSRIIIRLSIRITKTVMKQRDINLKGSCDCLPCLDLIS